MPKNGTSGRPTSIDIDGRFCVPETKVWPFAPPVSVAPEAVPFEAGEVDAAIVKLLPPRPSVSCVIVSVLPPVWA